MLSWFKKKKKHDEPEPSGETRPSSAKADRAGASQRLSSTAPGPAVASRARPKASSATSSPIIQPRSPEEDAVQLRNAYLADIGGGDEFSSLLDPIKPATAPTADQQISPEEAMKMLQEQMQGSARDSKKSYREMRDENRPARSGRRHSTESLGLGIFDVESRGKVDMHQDSEERIRGRRKSMMSGLESLSQPLSYSHEMAQNLKARRASLETSHLGMSADVPAMAPEAAGSNLMPTTIESAAAGPDAGSPSANDQAATRAPAKPPRSSVSGTRNADKGSIDNSTNPKAKGGRRHSSADVTVSPEMIEAIRRQKAKDPDHMLGENIYTAKKHFYEKQDTKVKDMCYLRSSMNHAGVNHWGSAVSHRVDGHLADEIHKHADAMDLHRKHAGPANLRHSPFH